MDKELEPMKFTLPNYGSVKDDFKKVLKEWKLVWNFLGKDDRGMSGMWTGNDIKVIGFFEGHEKPAHFTVDAGEVFIRVIKEYLDKLPKGEVIFVDSFEVKEKEQTKITPKAEWQLMKEDGAPTGLVKAAKKTWIRANFCTKCTNYVKDDTECTCDNFEAWILDDNPQMSM